jgi:hypothetical protein
MKKYKILRSVLICILVVVNFLFIPSLITVFQKEGKVVSLDDGGRNIGCCGRVELRGNVLLEYAVFIKSKNKDKQRGFYLIPVVGHNWEREDLISVIAKFSADDFDKLKKSIENKVVEGVVRSFWWDRFVIKLYEKKFTEYGLLFSKSCILVDTVDSDYNAVFILLVDLVILLFFMLYGKNKKDAV